MISTPTKLTPASAGMRPRNREPRVNWMMIFVLIVVVFGILLMVTGEFGAV